MRYGIFSGPYFALCIAVLLGCFALFMGWETLHAALTRGATPPSEQIESRLMHEAPRVMIWVWRAIAIVAFVFAAIEVLRLLTR